ncbi:pentapeptide repeat-containing protein [Streptomyces xanthochromogenes]|uniref:pentapeptide repeat-containing protein n=1 Tax=Streptomyces xanthochromogenes TaxID=67384 RepID=UPI00382A58FB
MNDFDSDAALDALLNTADDAVLVAVETGLDFDAGRAALLDTAPRPEWGEIPLFVAPWHGRRADGTDLSGADLQRANLTSYRLAEANLTRSNLYRAYLGGADLTRAVLIGANLFRATLVGANLTGASLTGANLAQARLAHANLRDADLRGADLYTADLTGANLLGTNLLGANLEQANLVGVRWSLETEWPPQIYASIRTWSEELEFGVFRVRADDARDRVELPELLPA